VSTLFGEGTVRVNREKVKELLVACAEANEQYPFGAKDGDKFFESVDRLVEYLHAHRLTADDLVELREWEARTFDVGDDPGTVFVKALTARIRAALRRVIISIERGEGGYEPRDALLCGVLSQPGITFPELTPLVRRLREKLRGAGQGDDDSGNELEAFLLAPEQKALWLALVRENEALHRSRNGPGHFEADDLVDTMLTNRGDPTEVGRALAKFMPLAEELLKGYPNFAMPERFDDITRLRAVWNVVHAYGDDQTKASYRKYIERLRDEFQEREDPVTVKWLDQVMEKPGNPPEKYVVRLQLGEPEKPEAKEPKDTKKGQK
jgi:hypothetical protein